ncbi:TPA: TolC family protein [Legionella pneumophila]|nr:TolC family protein [Legionella pneumophila]HAU2406558.1 TolC family protein [Legionella pneumophila]
MKKKDVLLGVVTIVYLYLGVMPFAFARNLPLTLNEAEHLAIATSPELQRLKAASSALRQQSIAEGQLPDPQLTAGAINVPTDTFSFTQDEMTMVQVGVQQQFARGRSLKMKSQQTRTLAKAELIKAKEQTLTLLRNVRETWLELYYWTQALRILRINQSLYKELLKVTESQYSTGKINQSDVVQVQLELSRLNNQAIQNQQQIDILKAQLGRWVGMENVNRPLALSMPHWPPLPSFNRLQNHLLKHPLLQADALNVEASCYEVAYAKEQYKPGWLFGISYGVRQGRMPDGMPRSDMLTAQVTMDLPFFTANRQDRQLSASFHRLNASQFDRHTHYRDLLQALTTQYAMWQRLSERDHLYIKQLLPEARQNAKAALLAYQNATTELTTVLRAYSSELTIQLEQIQLQVERLKTRATLLYLEGTVP